MTNDLISREAAKEAVKYIPWCDWAAVGRTLDELEAVDAVPVVHGRWDEPTGFEDGFWVCSACNYCTEETAAPTLYKYCPNCGTKMDEEY